MTDYENKALTEIQTFGDGTKAIVYAALATTAAVGDVSVALTKLVEVLPDIVLAYNKAATYSIGPSSFEKPRPTTKVEYAVRWDDGHGPKNVYPRPSNAAAEAFVDELKNRRTRTGYPAEGTPVEILTRTVTVSDWTVDTTY